MCLIKRIREKRLKKYQETMRGYLEFCLGHLGLTMNDLIPLSEPEFDSMLSSLKEKVNAIPPEPDRVYGPVPGYSIPNIYAWTEIVSSLKSIREVYRLTKDKACEKCEKCNLVLIRFRSSPYSWGARCGRDGYMIICPDCLTKLSFKEFMMS